MTALCQTGDIDYWSIAEVPDDKWVQFGVSAPTSVVREKFQLISYGWTCHKHALPLNRGKGQDNARHYVVLANDWRT